MNLKHLMINYAAYNAWANDSVVNWLRNKPNAVLFEETPASFSSLVKTLSHILAVQEFWEAIVTETPLFSNRYLAQEFDAEEIFTTIGAQSHKLTTLLGDLTDEDMTKEITLDLPWAKGKLPRFEFLQHVFNHSTYHRGQLTTIGRNVGLTDVPMLDYSFYNLAVRQG